MIRPAVLASALAALLLPAAAAGSLDFRGVDPSDYPHIRTTLVTSTPSRTSPALREDGQAATGVVALNLASRKSVALLIDVSRSMVGGSLKDAIAAARKFVDVKPTGDRIAVFTFGSKAQELTPFTTSRGEPSTALTGLQVDPYGGTALYDAVVAAAKELSHEENPGRIMVLVTDGHDVTSKASLADAVKAAHSAGAVVYSIGIKGRQFTPKALEALSNRTGGGYRSASSSSDLAGLYAAIARELRRTWRLDYVTAALPGDQVSLVATLAGQGSDRTRFTVPKSAGGPGRLFSKGVYSAAGVLALALLVAVLLVAAYWLLVSGKRSEELRTLIEGHVMRPHQRARKEKRGRLSMLAALFRFTERGLGQTRYWRRLDRLLARADLPLKTAELVYLMCGAALVLAFAFAVGGAPAILVPLAFVGGAALPLGFVSFKARRRLKAIESQLPDILMAMAASLKAGHSFKQALQGVVDEGYEPVGKEFRRVLNETRLGRSMDAALADLADRVGSKNLGFVVTAVSIQTQVGGSLANLFDMVSDTVRSRQQFARKVKALTAMGRMSAYVLIALPFFLAGLLTLINAGYMAPLFHTSTGRTLIFVALGMMTVGSTILKKMVSFKG